jgi:hypothetical protein
VDEVKQVFSVIQNLEKGSIDKMIREETEGSNELTLA